VKLKPKPKADHAASLALLRARAADLELKGLSKAIKLLGG
jgi:hypothetical protein